MSRGATQGLKGVWGSSGGIVFTKGWYGTILHYGSSAYAVDLPLVLRRQ